MGHQSLGRDGLEGGMGMGAQQHIRGAWRTGSGMMDDGGDVGQGDGEGQQNSN